MTGAGQAGASCMASTLMEAREALWKERHALFEKARAARISGDLDTAAGLWIRIDEISAQMRQAEDDIVREAGT